MHTEREQTSASIPAESVIADHFMGKVVQTKTMREKFFNLPEGTPCQFIAGDIIMTPSPIPVHQAIIRELFFQIVKFVKAEKAGQVFVAPLDVSLNENNVFQPDILFIRKDNESIIGSTMIEGAPDLVIEVLSPSSAYHDLRTKFRAYEKGGVKEYWIVDPERESVEVFTSSEEKFNLQQEVEGKGSVQSKILSGLSINLNDIFP